MRPRSRAGGGPVKTRRRKAVTPKRGNAPKASVRGSPPAGQETKVTRLTRERDEALERETATSEVLRIISNSPTDLQSALGAIAESAARLLDVAGAEISRVEGDDLRLMAKHGSFPQRPVGSIRPINRNWVTGRAVIDRTTVQVLDLQAAESEFPEGAASARQFGHRTTLATPLLREGNPIGAVLIRRMDVQNFAAQAVIAIENARLLNELRRRTTDLSEALEQQTATSEVLRVISSSSGNLQTVFETMLAKATDLCEASYGLMWLREEDAFRTAALHGDLPQAYRDQWRSGTRFRPGPELILSRVTASGRPIQVPDLRNDPSYLIGDPLPVAAADVAGVRTLLGVPMLRDKEAVGFIGIYRKEIRPFTEKQVTLVTNFAAQAVIAIENTRLLNELRQSLEQQTATADVLRIISSSPGELEPVFQAMLENATRICEANFGTMYLREEDAFRTVALHNAPPAYEERRRNPLIHLHPTSVFGRLVATKQVIHVADVRVDQGYLDGAPSTVDIADAAGARTVLAVPMLKDNELVGAITIYRQEVRPFSDKQIELVKNFAAQAVIAIENTRLLNELRQRTTDLTESLEQQTATSEVLNVISSSPGELEPVFQTMLQNATRLCDAKFGVLFEFADGAFRALSNLNTPPALVDFNRKLRVWGHPADGPCRGCSSRQRLPGRCRPQGRRPAGWRAHTPRRADAQGRRAGRRYHDLPSGSSSFH
jgi:GAF domain-containing protein